ADRDRRAGLQEGRAGRGLRRGHRAGARRDPHGPMTHAVVLIEAERDALTTLGGELAGLDGVAEAYSVTGEWDFVAIVRVPRPPPRAARRRHPRQARQAAGRDPHADDGRLRGVLRARPRGHVLDRPVRARAAACVVATVALAACGDDAKTTGPVEGAEPAGTT